MSRVSVFSSPLLLGFDEVERLLDRVAKTPGDGYPPYNIERLPPLAGKTDRLRITLAVAGFSNEELEVTLEENQLTIRGNRARTKSAPISIAALPRGSSSAHSSWRKAWR